MCGAEWDTQISGESGVMFVGLLGATFVQSSFIVIVIMMCEVLFAEAPPIKYNAFP